MVSGGYRPPAPVAYFSVTSLGFGTVAVGQTATQTLTVSNIGEGPLVLTSAVVAQSPSFTLTQIACTDGETSLPATLAAAEGCILTISYLAPSGTPPNGTITFTDNAALSSPPSTPAGSNYTQSIALTGSGASTAPLPPPSATVTIPTINEMIMVSDTETFPDVPDTESIIVTDKVSVTTVPPVVKIVPQSVNPYIITAGAGTYNVSITLMNSGNVLINELNLLNGALIGVGPLTFPAGTTLTNIAPGASATFTGTISSSAGAAGKSFPLSFNGSYSVGSLSGLWTINFRSVKLP